MSFKEKLKKVFLNYNFELSNLQIDRYYKYYKLLIEWNKKFNLTSIVEEDEVIIKHFIDSVLPEKEFKPSASILDLGTGAGFPGIPLKILREDLNITLLDSLKKRVVFLDYVIKELELNNIKAVHSRAETFARDVLFRETYDFCVSRAVAKINILLELGSGIIKVGGEIVSYKSNKIDVEIEDAESAANVLFLKLDRVKEYQVNEINAFRNIVFYKKLKPTPNKYPRGKDKPRKDPL